MRYVRQRESVVGRGSVGLENEREGGKGDGAGERAGGTGSDEDEVIQGGGKVKEKEWRQRQKVYVLEGGFQAWQQA